MNQSPIKTNARITHRNGCVIRLEFNVYLNPHRIVPIRKRTRLFQLRTGSFASGSGAGHPGAHAVNHSIENRLMNRGINNGFLKLFSKKSHDLSGMTGNLIHLGCNKEVTFHATEWNETLCVLLKRAYLFLFK